MIQKVRIGQSVIDNDIGGVQQMNAAERDQLRVARTGADEKDDSWGGQAAPFPVDEIKKEEY